mgnify:CR=1 FL=1
MADTRQLVGVEVRSNIRAVRATFSHVTEQVESKATVRALNRALDQSATEVSKRVREVYNLKHRAVLKAMRKLRANRNRLRAVIEIRGSRIGLIEFDAHWTRNMRGASIREKISGGRKTIAHSFIATIRSGRFAGYRGVAVREGHERYLIRFLRGISLPTAFREKTVLEAVRKVARESFMKNFKQQIIHLGQARIDAAL